MISQIAIGVAGVSTIYLSLRQDERQRRWAPLIGIAAQPFWFYSTYQAQQWGIFLLSAVYLTLYLERAWFYWRPR